MRDSQHFGNPHSGRQLEPPEDLLHREADAEARQDQQAADGQAGEEQPAAQPQPQFRETSCQMLRDETVLCCLAAEDAAFAAWMASLLVAICS